MPHWSPYFAPVAAHIMRKGSPFAAAGAGSRAADVDVRLLLEHHVDQQIVVDVLLVGWGRSF